MSIYFLILFLSVFFALLYKITKYKILWIISLLVVSFFAGLRYFVGIDYESYTFIFASIANSSTEPAFRLINLIVFFSGLNVQFVFIISSLLTFSFFYNGIRKLSNDVFLSIFILLFCGFFIESLNIIRQYIAISIFFFSIRYIINKDFKRYLLCIACAVCFHYSAVFLILAYFFLRINVGKWWFLILCFAYVLPFVLPIQFVFGLIPGYNIYFGAVSAANESAQLGIGFLSKLLIGFVCLSYFNKIISFSSESKIYLNGFFTYLFLLSFFRDFMVMVRLGYYFHVFLILLAPKFIQIFDKNARIVGYILFLVYGILLLTINLSDSDAKLVPYNYFINLLER